MLWCRPFEYYSSRYYIVPDSVSFSQELKEIVLSLVLRSGSMAETVQWYMDLSFVVVFCLSYILHMVIKTSIKMGYKSIIAQYICHFL